MENNGTYSVKIGVKVTLVTTSFLDVIGAQQMLAVVSHLMTDISKVTHSK